MSTRKERRAALMAVVKTALKAAPPGVDRKFVLAALKPAIESLLDRAEQNDRIHKLEEAEAEEANLYLKPYRDTRPFGYEAKHGQFLRNMNPTWATYELQDFLHNLRDGFSAERFSRAERQHRLEASAQGSSDPTWTGFPGSAYLYSGSRWFVLLCRSRKWGLATMLLHWLRQVRLEVIPLTDRKRSDLQAYFGRQYDDSLHHVTALAQAREQGTVNELQQIEALQKVYRIHSSALLEADNHFVKDRYGNQWLQLRNMADDLAISMMNATAWDNASSTVVFPPQMNPLKEPALAEMRLIVGASALQKFKVVRNREDYATIAYAMSRTHRDLLEAFRLNPAMIDDLAERSAWATQLDQMDWIDSLNEVEIFEAAAGERAFPNLDQPRSILSDQVSEELKASKQKSRSRAKNGGGIGVGSVVVGAALGAVAVAVWRSRAA
jgi:hypothetical protein